MATNVSHSAGRSEPRKSSAKRQRKMVSVTFPVFDEQDNVLPLYEEVTSVLDKTKIKYELVFVDNGSNDESLDRIRGLAEKDSRIRYVSLSRNFGHQAGIFAGLAYSAGDAVITMDADLQHPADLLPEMIEAWDEGYEVVFTIKRNHHLPWFHKLQVKAFYWVISKLSGLRLSYGQSDFRLMDRRVVDAVLAMPEYRKFLRGIVEWVGFRQKGLEFDVKERRSGESKFSFMSLASFAFDGILSFSVAPLRTIIVSGMVLAVFALLYGFAALGIGIASIADDGITLPPGWATIAAAVTFFAGVQLIAIGALGEYIARTYEQTKGRPVFVVREVSDALNAQMRSVGRSQWSKSS